MLSLLVVALLGQGATMAGTPVSAIGGAPPGDFFTYLLSAPAVGSQCTDAVITSDQATAITCTRSSEAFCTKSDGSMVLHSADRCRIEGAGLLPESIGTNLAARYNAIDTAPWASFNTGAVAPTVTANAAVAPDGTTTAEQLDFPAVGASQASYRYNPLATSEDTITNSIYLKGCAGSGSLWVWSHDNSNPLSATPCAYNASTWTRCVQVSTSVSAVARYLIFGVDARDVLQGTSSAQCVYAWGGDAKARASADSLVATAAGGATRAGDQVVPTVAREIRGSGCISALVTFPAGAPPDGRFWVMNSGLAYLTGAGPGATTITQDDQTNAAVTSPSAVFHGNARTILSKWSGTTMLHSLSVDGVAGTAGTFDGVMATNDVINIGSNTNATNALYSHFRAIKINSSPAGCQ